MHLNSLQARQHSRENLTEVDNICCILHVAQYSLPNEPIITKADDYQSRFQAEVVDILGTNSRDYLIFLGPVDEPSEWPLLRYSEEEDLLTRTGDQRSDEDFVLVDQPDETESLDSPRNSSHKPSFTTLTAMFGFNNATPPPPTPLSIASSEWNIQINETRKKSGFTGHSRVLFSAGGQSSQEGIDGGDSSTSNQYLSRNPWNWSCPIPRLRILLMAVGTRFIAS